MTVDYGDESKPLLEKPEDNGCYEFPARYAVIVLGFVGFMNIAALKGNMGVAIVAMVNSSSQSVQKEGVSSTCANFLQYSSNGTLLFEEQPSDGEFNWNPEIQSLILGAFFYGYILTKIPGGVIANRFGAKHMLAAAFFFSSLFTILTPLGARAGVVPVSLVRVCVGLGLGATIPALHALLARWAPKDERNFMCTLVFCGDSVGVVIVMSVSGVLARSDFLGGWPAIFYVFGSAGLIWSFIWLFLAHDKPTDHPRISKSEVLYIQGDQDEGNEEARRIPWTSILMSVHVWALVIAHFCEAWGSYTYLTEIPTYLANVLHFDIEMNGILSSIPYILKVIIGCVASYAADKLRYKSRLSVTAVRKIFNSLAFFGPAMCMLSVALVGCRPVLIVSLLSLGMGLTGFAYAGYYITHVDMIPEYAGTIMGICSAFSNIPGFLAPYAVGKIIIDGQTLENWRLVFFLCSAIYVVGGVVFQFFATAEPQTWGINKLPAIEVKDLEVSIEEKRKPR